MSEKKKQQDAMQGVISITARGIGYVSVTDREEDIEIPKEHLGGALHRDVVSIRHIGKKGGREQGSVISVDERARTRFVGVVEARGAVYQFVGDDTRLYTTFSLPESTSQRAVGQKVLVHFIDWKKGEDTPRAEVIDIIGTPGEHETEMRAISLSQGFTPDFPKEVQDEADAISRDRERLFSVGIEERRDMRGIPTMTIDPIDAKDFDDAISYEVLPDGTIEVGVHIADVGHYVEAGSTLDMEARDRGTSVYLVDRTIPMLPEVISNDICSLRPKEDRLAFSAIFSFSPELALADTWFGKTVICSDKRFSYEEAQEVLEKMDGEFSKELTTLNTLAKKLRRERMQAGSIDFDQDEVKFQLDSSGAPVSVTLKERKDAHLLIEDLMLLANKRVAEYIYELCKKLPNRAKTFVYRIHDVPDPEKIEALGIFVRALGYNFDTEDGLVDGKDINQMLKQVEGVPEEDLIKTATIRSMAKAIYSTKNVGHFGLSFRYYTHFTSPIRRYPDLIVHRILASHLNGSPLSKDELSEYERLAVQSSERELSAVEAERESIKYKQVEFLSKKVGSTFSATISGVTEYGFFVQEKETHAEGLVRVAGIGDDYYRYERDKYQLIGEKTGTRFRLGDTVSVKLTKANLEDKQLDFELVKN